MGLPAEVETRQLERLIEAIEDLRRRVTELEQERRTIPSSSTSLLPFLEPAPGSASDSGMPSGLLAAFGRLLLGLAGAYFLRAITEAHILPQLAGTIVGLLYAAAWLLSFLRFAPSGRAIVALHGVTASLIAAPLVWEATLRFHSFSPTAAALALALTIVLGQLIGWRPNLSLICGVAALAGTATAIALIIATLDPIPFAIAMVAAAVVVETGACRDRGLSMRWIIALAADFCAFLLIYVRTRPQGLPEGYAPVPLPAVITVLVALVATYVTSIVVRTLMRRLPFTPFEIVQAAAVVIFAVAGALRIAPETSTGVVCGTICLVAGTICYLVAFTNLSAASVAGRNFHAYATFGVLLTAAGSSILLRLPALAVIWSLLALFATWLGERRNGNTLRMHGAFYLLAAAAASDLLTCTARSMTGASADRPTASAVVCAFAVVAGYALTLRQTGRTRQDRIAPAILAALLCWTTAGFAAFALFGGVDPALGATLRTAIICLIGFGLTWFGRGWNVSELIWLVYPWMTLGAVKLLAEDFRQGRPATLFLSLLIYGGTLIVLPRLWRRAKPA